MVPTYIQEDFFQDALVTNLELNACFSNTSISIDLALEDKLPYQMGKTFLKILFLPFPRDVLTFKPKSFVDSYTTSFMPNFRKRGGSAPPSIIGETYVNFHIFFPLFIVLIFTLWDYITIKKLIVRKKPHFSNLIIIMLLTTSIQFTRGAGIEMYALYVLLSTPFIIMGYYIVSNISRVSIKKSS